MRYLLFAFFVFMGPNQNINAKTMKENVFKLIRNNHVNPLTRVHIATFDSANGPDFNAQNSTYAISTITGMKTRPPISMSIS